MDFTLCHCKPERSIIIAGKPFLCYRCFGILASLQVSFYFLVVLKLVFQIDPLVIIPFTLPWVFIPFLLVTPLFIDGFTQKWEWRLSNNKIRLLTGVSFGIGAQICTLWLILLIKSVGSSLN